MKLHFVIVTEPFGKYLNMAKLLLYSFRKNAGIYSDCPFTIVTNGSDILDSDFLEIEKMFSPIIRTMPRLGAPHFGNKFNALYAIDDSNYDALVFLDCDTAILSVLDNITEGCEPGKPFFKAISSGKLPELIGYENLLIKFGNLNKEGVVNLKDNNFLVGYPLFNGGVYIISKEAVKAIRNDAIGITYELFYGPLTSPSAFVKYAFQRFISKTFGYGISYPLWLSEQMGLALSVVKHRIPFQFLDERFNWNSANLLPSGAMPSVFHYMKGIYSDIDRNNLFDSEWIENYINSDSPVKQTLGQLAKSYPLL